MTINDDLPAFIRQQFRSLWALEIMLVMQADPERRWRVDELVRELRASQTLVRGNLEGFERSGLVVRDAAEVFRFAPANAGLRELCDQVRAAYRERPVAIINLIAAPEERLQQLADAFRIVPPAK
jgi:hypothetical protein